MYILGIDKNNEVLGFYHKNIHKSIPEKNIQIDNELWQYLLNIGSFKIKEEYLDSIFNSDKVFNISDKDMFEVNTADTPQLIPNIPTDVELLRQEVKELRTLVNSLVESKNI